MQKEQSLITSTCVLAGIFMLAGTPAAFAAGAYTQIGTIAVPGGISQIDILWVDTSSDLMYLANDGSTKGAGRVDVFDVHADRFLYSLGLGSFVGLFDATHCCNGPTGVLPIPAQSQLWAGDGNSTVKVFDLDRGNIIANINTGGKQRADEMAWDSKDHLLIIGNPNESPNFLTVINTDTLQIQGKIFYPNSSGLEQPVWDPLAERFYVPIDGNVSEVDAIDPTKVNGNCTISTGLNCGVTNQAFVPSCSGISGMALLPNERLMLSCGIILNMPGGTIAATPNPAGTALGDEIYYNPGDNQVYFGQASPSVIDTGTNQLVGTLPAAKPGSHIVAANSNNNHVYLPSPGCGCIEVFGPAADQPAGTPPFSH